MNGYNAGLLRQRFRNVPGKIIVPLLHEDEESNSVEVDLEALNDDPTELCLLLEAERTTHLNWIIIALAYVKSGKTDEAIEIMTKGLEAPSVRAERSESVPLQSCLLWLYLHKARQAIKAPFNAGERHDERTKDYYLQQATTLLNQLSRFDPDHPAYVMGRAVYSSLKASITNSKADKQTNWDIAMKLYEDAVKRSSGSNMFAMMGRARMLFQKKKYERALEAYQEVLLRRPDMDPDPRIGIGMCFWMLGHKDDARGAWQRALETDPESKIANILLGVYFYSLTTGLSEHDEKFEEYYKKAINDYVQKAYKKDKELPLACTMFALHFFSVNNWNNLETLAKKAIEFTDVGQVASDAYYLLGRACQQKGEYELARQYYARSENARDEGSYLPAKVGSGQLQILMKDMTGAKFIFENLMKTNSKCLEAMVILGTLYAMEVFEAAASTASPKEDKSVEHKKAITYLETVRNSWKDPSKNISPTPAVLLTLARLYESENPEKALHCLQQVADIERDQSELDEPLLSPRLLNNMAVFHYAAGRYDQAREHFQTAMNNGKALSDKGEITDFESILATMTFNLARLEEAAGNDEEAIKYYEQVLSRQKDYVEASMRLAYLSIKKGDDEGARRLEELLKSNDHNLELSALYGWYLSRRPKKAPLVVAEDREQRHYKRTLQQYDKHDRYSLTGMGNIHLQAAREMRRDTDNDREKRRKVYEKAVEFFEKALQLDSKNAYAAQGIAIALVEDCRDYTKAVSLFNRVKETIRDATVYINLGHCLTELKQYTRAIESYETAVKKYGAGSDPWILTCIAKVWLLKGKEDQNIANLNTALGYAKQALALSPDAPMYMFNVAFLQVQISNIVLQLPPTKRTAKDIQDAFDGNEESILTFDAVAKSKKPPYPAADIEQRATMGRNTTRKQLNTILEAQKAYEKENASRIAAARQMREDEEARRKAEVQKAQLEKEEKARRLAEERRALQEQAREWAEQKEGVAALEKEEAERKASRRREGGGAGSRSKRTKKPGDQDADSADDDTPGGYGPAKKKRKLAGRSKKYTKSADFIDDSDELLSDEDLVVNPSKDDAGSRSATPPSASASPSPPPPSKSKKVVLSDDDLDDDEDMEVVRTRRPVRRIASDDEDDDMSG